MMSEPDEDQPIKLVRKVCGIHWGLEPGPCAKCQYFATLPQERETLQHFVASLGEKATEEQVAFWKSIGLIP